MKIFWAVLVLVMIASVAYLTMGREKGGSAPKVAAVKVEPTAPRAPGAKDNDEGAFFAGDSAAVPAELPKVIEAPTPTPPAVTPKVEETAAPADKPVVEETPTATAPVEEKKPEEAAPTPKPETTPTPAAAVPAPAVPAPAPAASAGGTAVTFGEDAKIVRNEDGTMMVDDKYPLKGEGTAEKPYEITWEYLVSAQEDYQPRLGKKKLPGRMKLISGKRVRITGFVAFPIMATEPTEMLAMLNQWDGCCIGIPPTPYDAVEVKLKDPADNDQRLITFGTVEGNLIVEPYLVRDWLVSLYTMDEATMERAQ